MTGPRWICPCSASTPSLSSPPPSVEAGEIRALNEIAVSPTAADAGINIGSVITLDRLDVELTAVGFTKGQTTFGHVDMAYLPLGTWQHTASGQSQPGAPAETEIAALDFDTASAVTIKAEVAIKAEDVQPGTSLPVTPPQAQPPPP